MRNAGLEETQVGIMDGGAWQAAVHGVAKSQTQMSDFTFTFHFHALEKEMATHSSVLAWRIPGTGEPGGCRLWGHTESDVTEVTQQHSVLLICVYGFCLFVCLLVPYCFDYCDFVVQSEARGA